MRVPGPNEERRCDLMRKAALMRLLALAGPLAAVLVGGDTVWPK
jgi:hypothetical protein